MKSITIKKLYALHSWVGIITGILLFIIAFTGAVAVFARPELKIWAHEQIRAKVEVNPQRYEQVISEYADKVETSYHEELHVRFPGARSSQFASVVFEGHFENEQTGKEEHKGMVYLLEPTTLKQQHEMDLESFFNSHELDMATFIAHFHADLHLGRPVGLILTGLLGLTLMVSIVTGIFIHRKILAQLFTFRIRKSFSLALNDGHKAMGVWAVLFHSVIAFTGAFLGLATVILVPAAAYVGFNGDEEKLIETFTAIKPPVISHVESPTKIEDILEHSLSTRPDLDFSNFTVMGYGDENALVYVFGTGSDVMGGETLVYQGATGEYVRSQANFGRLEGVTGKILDAMFPLHFGNFGGLFVKTIWAILGLATALLPITGLMLWIERGLNAQNPAHSKNTYRNINNLLLGSCGGVVLATIVLFPGQVLMNQFLAGQSHTSLIFTLFFVTWFLATVLPFVISYARSLKTIVYLSAWSMMLVMPLDVAFTGSHLLNMFETGHYVSNGVNLVLLLLGAWLLWTYTSFSKKSSKRNSSIDTQNNQALSEPVDKQSLTEEGA